VSDDWLIGHARRLGEALGALESLTEPLEAAAEAIASSLRAGGTVLTAGNGGSAAEAHHLAGELVGRLTADREREPLRAVALTGDPSIVSAIANDYGFEQVFARQVAALARPGDVLVLLSTSGSSPNLVAAARRAAAGGVTIVGLLGGTARQLHGLCDHVIAVPSTSVATIQECHLVLVHALVARVEDRLAGSG